MQLKRTRLHYIYGSVRFMFSLQATLAGKVPRIRSFGKQMKRPPPPSPTPKLMQTRHGLNTVRWEIGISYALFNGLK